MHFKQNQDGTLCNDSNFQPLESLLDYFFICIGLYVQVKTLIKTALYKLSP